MGGKKGSEPELTRKKNKEEIKLLGGFIVIGTIVLYHIDDKVLVDNKIDLKKLNPVGRLAGSWYTKPTDNFKIERKIKPNK